MEAIAWLLAIAVLFCSAVVLLLVMSKSPDDTEGDDE